MCFARNLSRACAMPFDAAGCLSRAGLSHLSDAGVPRVSAALFRHDWVVYAKPPFGGPAHVLQYLARYTHRVAISNHRIVNMADDTVTFRWKDYRHGSQPRTHDDQRRGIPASILAPRPAEGLRPHPLLWVSRASMPGSRPPTVSARAGVLRAQALATPTVETTAPSAAWPCPRCGGAMIVIERLTAHQIYGRALAEGSS